MQILQPRSNASDARSAARRKFSSAPTKRKITGKKTMNPVLESAEFAYKAIDLVQINDEGVKSAARYIKTQLTTDSYTPRTWRTHPLHICPVDSANITDPRNKLVLDWIFLISSLNFSFWSERQSKKDIFGVEWRASWMTDDVGERVEGENGKEDSQVWTGYWSLVASLDRAIADDKIPIIDPQFYSDETQCPDSLIEHVFRPADPCREAIPLLKERISIMRDVGKKMCDDFNGSYLYFIQSFHKRHNGKGTALDLVKMVTETFPSFRDETWIDGHKVYLWKRAQILVAETWAAFYPPSPSTPHPIFASPPGPGPQIHQLTMFADYRVPQILHHLRILSYPTPLVDLLERGTMLPNGSREEVSLRTASIVAVERVRRQMVKMQRERQVGRNGKYRKRYGMIRGDKATTREELEEISSVLIDFYLWDLAKRIEDGEDRVEGIETAELVPLHRTRSIWY